MRIIKAGFDVKLLNDGNEILKHIPIIFDDLKIK